MEQCGSAGAGVARSEPAYHLEARAGGTTSTQCSDAVQETESRATDLLPIWKLPGASLVVPRCRKAAAAVDEIRATTEMLIAQCKAIVDEEEKSRAEGAEEYVNAEDPSILRFLIASRDEVSAVQLRDDLLGMLVAGHETTASVLTWTVYFLAQCPEQMRKLQVRNPFSSAPTESCAWRWRRGRTSTRRPRACTRTDSAAATRPLPRAYARIGNSTAPRAHMRAASRRRAGASSALLANLCLVWRTVCSKCGTHIRCSRARAVVKLSTLVISDAPLASAVWEHNVIQA